MMFYIYNTNFSFYIIIVITLKYFSTILFLSYQRKLQDESKVSLELIKVPLEKYRQSRSGGVKLRLSYKMKGTVHSEYMEDRSASQENNTYKIL